MAKSSARRRAVARPLGDGRIGIWTDFADKADVRALPGARRDGGLKCWTVPTIFVADAVAIVARLNSRNDRLVDATDVVALSDAIAAVLDSLAPSLRRAVYRALAHVLHPDRGGDTEAMQALNEAWNGGAC